MKDTQYIGEKTEGQTTIYKTLHRKLKDRQHNGHIKKDKRTNNDLQNITQKTKR